MSSLLSTAQWRRREFALLLFAAAIVATALVSLNLASNIGVSKTTAWIIGGFIGVFTLAHIGLCFLAPRADQFMLPIAALLNGLGLVMVYRLDLANETSLANKQVIWSFLGVFLMVLVLLFIRDHAVLSKYSYILGLVGLIMLALPLVWPSNIQADAKIWISLFGFSLQPGEFAKVLLLLFFAQLLVNKRALFNVAGYRIFGLEFPRLRDLGPILAAWAIAVLIMAGQSDFGPALLLVSTVFGMIYIATSRVSWLIIGTVLVAVAGFGLYNVSDKIQTRFNNFIDPLAHYDTTGYQLSQGLFAFGSGGLGGTGLGQGHPDLVPLAFSDYILASFGEELGFVTVAAIMVLFAIFVSRGMVASLRARDSYGKLVAAGLALTVAVQVFVVTGGVTALIPMTGLTTPFMSAGGSSVMANYILMGLILRISNSGTVGVRR